MFVDSILVERLHYSVKWRTGWLAHAAHAVHAVPYINQRLKYRGSSGQRFGCCQNDQGIFMGSFVYVHSALASPSPFILQKHNRRRSRARAISSIDPKQLETIFPPIWWLFNSSTLTAIRKKFKIHLSEPTENKTKQKKKMQKTPDQLRREVFLRKTQLGFISSSIRVPNILPP